MSNSRVHTSSLYLACFFCSPSPLHPSLASSAPLRPRFPLLGGVRQTTSVIRPPAEHCHIISSKHRALMLSCPRDDVLHLLPLIYNCLVPAPRLPQRAKRKTPCRHPSKTDENRQHQPPSSSARPRTYPSKKTPLRSLQVLVV
jgi:hypothetical protein